MATKRPSLSRSSDEKRLKPHEPDKSEPAVAEQYVETQNFSDWGAELESQADYFGESQPASPMVVDRNTESQSDSFDESQPASPILFGDSFSVDDSQAASPNLDNQNKCEECGTDMGQDNTRQLCGKTSCNNPEKAIKLAMKRAEEERWNSYTADEVPRPVNTGRKAIVKQHLAAILARQHQRPVRFEPAEFIRLRSKPQSTNPAGVTYKDEITLTDNLEINRLTLFDAPRPDFEFSRSSCVARITQSEDGKTFIIHPGPCKLGLAVNGVKVTAARPLYVGDQIEFKHGSNAIYYAKRHVNIVDVCC